MAFNKNNLEMLETKLPVVQKGHRSTTCPTCKSDLNTAVRKDTCFYCSQALKWR